jgi:hypothetical protein
MRFVVVNHRAPFSGSACSTCARPLASGYIRHVPTKQRYCDYECYRRRQYKLVSVTMPWLTSACTTPAADGFAPACRDAVEVIALMGAVSCWSCTTQMWVLLRSLAEATLSALDHKGGDR